MVRLTSLFRSLQPTQDSPPSHDPSPAPSLALPHPLRNPARPEDSTPDFCNAFWGEAGYECLLGQLKQSSRMLDDLRLWYKERSAIESEYSRKLHRLSKSPLLLNPSHSRDAIGLKAALAVVRQSTERSAHSHAELAGTIKTALYGRVSGFIDRRDAAKKNTQATVERLRKNLVDLRAMQDKSRRRYEADTVAINGYVTQLHLIQGRDMDKVSNKLDKAKMSIKVTNKEYRLHTQNLQDTTEQWIAQWKAFCDLMQDLEEDRVDFVRSTFWDYANGISAICVAEDEQCEKIRQSLERCEAEEEIKSYVRQAATGNEYTLAPTYVDYTHGDIPRAPVVVRSNFTRSSGRGELEDTTLVPLSPPIQGLMDNIQAGPPAQGAAPPPSSKSSSTVWEIRKKVKQGGMISEAISQNRLDLGSPRKPDEKRGESSLLSNAQTMSSLQVQVEPPNPSTHMVLPPGGSCSYEPASCAPQYLTKSSFQERQSGMSWAQCQSPQLCPPAQQNLPTIPSYEPLPHEQKQPPTAHYNASPTVDSHLGNDTSLRDDVLNRPLPPPPG